MRRVRDDVGRELAQDPPAGRAPAGVDHAAHGVPALEAERELAVRSASKRTPSASRSREARGRLVAQDLGGAAAHEAAAGASVSSRCWRGRVLLGERGGQAALRPVGGGLGERPRGDSVTRAPSRAAHSEA